MLNHIFMEVRMRGAQRAAASAHGGDLSSIPPHQFVVAPLVEELTRPDYCAATMNADDQANLASLVAGMSARMDALEQEKAEAETAAQEGLAMCEQLGKRITEVETMWIQRLTFGAITLSFIMSTAALIWG